MWASGRLLEVGRALYGGVTGGFSRVNSALPPNHYICGPPWFPKLKIVQPINIIMIASPAAISNMHQHQDCTTNQPACQIPHFGGQGVSFAFGLS